MMLIEDTPIHEIMMQALWGTGMTPAEINDGWCGEVADKVVRRLGRGKVLSTDDTAVDHPQASSRHQWVHVDGKHYDAETPYGVAQPQELGYFRRLAGDPMPPTNYEPDINHDDDY